MLDVEGGPEARGDLILAAVGRQPNVEKLALDKAGIEATRAGITVDKGLRTTNRKAYAIGDVAGGLQFTHVAGYHAGLVVRNALFRLPITAKTDHIPWATYTDPEIAQIGPTEAEARKQREPRSRSRALNLARTTARAPS